MVSSPVLQVVTDCDKNRRQVIEKLPNYGHMAQKLAVSRYRVGFLDWDFFCNISFLFPSATVPPKKNITKQR